MLLGTFLVPLYTGRRKIYVLYEENVNLEFDGRLALVAQMGGNTW
jgi:hypothetical protein